MDGPDRQAIAAATVLVEMNRVDIELDAQASADQLELYGFTGAAPSR